MMFDLSVPVSRDSESLWILGTWNWSPLMEFSLHTCAFPTVTRLCSVARILKLWICSNLHVMCLISFPHYMHISWLVMTHVRRWRRYRRHGWVGCQARDHCSGWCFIIWSTFKTLNILLRCREDFQLCLPWPGFELNLNKSKGAT